MRSHIWRVLVVLSLSFVLTSSVSPTKKPAQKEMIDYVIEYLGIFTNLEFAEVMSTIQRESGGKEDCKTWEPKANQYSYGALQILGTTSRTLGYKGKLEDLRTYKYGLYYGMAYLSDCKARAVKIIDQDPSTALLSRLSKERKIRAHMRCLYNAGRIYWKKGHEGEKYGNHDYVIECEYLYWRYKKFNYMSIGGKKK